MSKEKDNISDPEVAPPEYSGSDRRAPESAKIPPAPVVKVKRDSRGNTVLNVTTVIPRRRKDDETINLQSLLDVDSLSICDEEGLDEDSIEDDDFSE